MDMCPRRRPTGMRDVVRDAQRARRDCEGRWSTISRVKPNGDNNAQPFRKSWICQSRAMRSLRWQVWSDPLTIFGQFHFVPANASSASELAGKMTAIGRLAQHCLQPAGLEPREGLVMLHASKQYREYMETARTLLRAAQTMTDRAVAGQLRASAEDYERRADRAPRGVGDKSSARLAAIN